MQYLDGAIYDSKPDDIVVYPSCVDVVLSCKEVELDSMVSGGKLKKFECNVKRYTIPEYIDMIQKRNGELEEQMTQAQIGIVEAYEMILGIM